MAENSVCQTCRDFIKQVKTLCERYDDLFHGRGIGLNHENVPDRWCRLMECRAIIDHTRGIQKELALHALEHGCGTLRATRVRYIR